MRRHLAIVNPAAGAGRARRLWPQVARALEEAGVRLDSVESTHAGAAIDLAERGAQDYDALIAVGGDGTVHEVANGLLRASGGAPTRPLGVVALGSGDDFAKLLVEPALTGGKPRAWPDAVRAIAAGRTRAFDAGLLCTGNGAAPRWFANGMDIGFGAVGAANARAMPRRLTGLPRYLGALAKTLLRYPSLRVRMRIDDAPAREQGTTMTAVMLGRCFGSSFWVCPQALPDDGLFDLMIAPTLSRREILGLVPRIMKGTHVDDPRIRFGRARRVELESDTPFDVEADGELPFAATPRVSVEIVSGALRVLA